VSRLADLRGLVRRIPVVWALEALAFLLLDILLPGLQLSSLQAALWSVVVLGLLNALVRPVLVFLTLPFTVLSFGVLTLGLNALMLVFVDRLVPGFQMQGAATPLVAALALAAINTLATSLVALDEEESFHRHIVRRIAGRSPPAGEPGGPGLILLEIDGLSASTFCRALDAGLMPTLGRWLSVGSHRLGVWDCGVPSQTSACQAGILYGDCGDIPGFRWYEKETRRLFVSNHPADAAEIDRRLAPARGLLAPFGTSVGNLLSGGAARSVLTMSTLTVGVTQRSSDFYLYLLDPYGFARTVVLMLADVVLEVWQSVRQWLRDVQPRVHRGLDFALLRAISTVLLRDLGVYFLVEGMYAGVPIVYATFVGYDVVAHHAGPERPDALRVLRDLDRRFAALERAALHAPRPYRFVVLSDHGQSQGATFRQRYGLTFETLVRGLLRREHGLVASVGSGEGWGHLNALLSATIQNQRPTARAARRALRRRTHGDIVALGPPDAREVADADVVVCASGNLGLVYFADRRGRLTLEEVAASFPDLVEGLVAHEGIGFVLVRSRRHGALVLGASGTHFLAEGRVEGEDPLGPFGPRAAEALRRLDACANVGDLVVNSRFDPDTGEVAAFEDLVGSHGGLGGPQTRPFVLVPAEWAAQEPEIVGGPGLHALLCGWFASLGQEAAAGGLGVVS